MNKYSEEKYIYFMYNMYMSNFNIQKKKGRNKTCGAYEEAYLTDVIESDFPFDLYMLVLDVRYKNILIRKERKKEKNLTFIQNHKRKKYKYANIQQQQQHHCVYPISIDLHQCPINMQYKMLQCKMVQGQ